MADTKPKLTSGTSPKGTAVYPRLNKPDTKFKAEGVFSTRLVVPGNAVEDLIKTIDAEAEAALADTLQKLEEKVATAKGKDLVKAKASLEKMTAGPLPYDPEYDDEGNETGNYVFSFKTNATYTDKKTGKTIHKKVTMFDAKGAKMEGKQPDIWGGSVLRVNYTIAPYSNAAANNAGVSLRINAVQVIELVSSGGGNAGSYGFGEEEGYSAAEDNPSGGTFDDESSGSASGGDDDDDL